jgi:PadR family transcriptional regulator PadR
MKVQESDFKKGSVGLVILAVLDSAGSMHGYAIAREVERRSGDVFKLGEGALYPNLRAMEADGLVEAEWQVQPSGPARRVYQITKDGRKRLAEQVKTWRSFTSAVESVLTPASFQQNLRVNEG